MTKVDVIVPCYNYGRFLEACVQSVLEQSIVDVRVLIIDDASSDDSLCKANNLAKSDTRVSVISHSENWGHVRTYNQGIAWASADYLLLLSADDLLVPGALERATRIMDEHPDIVLTHGAFVNSPDDLPLPEVSAQQTLTWERQDIIQEMCGTGTNVVSTPSAIARTSVQKAIGGYREILPHAGDMEMWLRFASQGAVAKIAAVQCIYRKHSSNMSISYYVDKLPDYRQRKAAFDTFFQENNNLIPNSDSLHAQANRVLAERAYWSGIAQLCRGNLASGRELLKFSFGLRSRLRFCPPVAILVKTPNLYKS